jgi:hypothetical protein
VTPLARTALVGAVKKNIGTYEIANAHDDNNNDFARELGRPVKMKGKRALIMKKAESIVQQPEV